MIHAGREIAPLSSRHSRTPRSVFGQRNIDQGRSTMCRLHGEPKLNDLLNDPIMDLLLKRDGVRVEELVGLLERARRRRKGESIPLQ
jgi:hypothetical protein